MKIAIDIRHLCVPNPTGINRFTLEVIPELARLAPDIRFLLFASGSAKALSYLPSWQAPNICITRKQTPNRLISAMMLLKSGPTLEDFLPERPDKWWFPNINIIRTALPYLITLHDLSFEFYPEFFTCKDRLWHAAARPQQLANGAQKIFAVSAHTKRDIVRHYGIPPKKITVTPLGVHSVFHPESEPSDKNFLRSHSITFPYFLSICSIEPRKNIESIIQAYELWRSRLQTTNYKLQTTHLLIAGSYGWKSKHIFSQIKNSPYKNCIHVLGYIPEKHKPALYRQASAFIFPSFYEGFGLPVLEALACGTKIIASFSGSLPEIAGNNALYIDPYNVRDLAMALSEIEHIPVPDSIHAQQFSWHKTAQKMLTQM